MHGFIGNLEPSENWTDEFLDWEFWKDDLQARVCSPNHGYKALRDGQAEGPLLGGCINSLLHVLGAPFNPDWTGTILFVENSEVPGGVSLYDSLLHDLRNAGIFASIIGLLVGRPYHFSPSEVEQLYALIKEVTKEYVFPIIANVDFGHTDPKATLPIGVRTEMSAGMQSQIIIKGPTVM
jgi:muramoyltetrapeptide carboxypeptidase